MSRRTLIVVFLTALQLAAFGDASAPATQPDPASTDTLSTLLDRINRDRKRHDLRPLTLDRELSEVASLRCARLIDDQTHGHFSTDGLPPYLRYSMAGFHDYIEENVASWSSPRAIPDSAVAELLIRSHNEMLTELPPDDGHRRAILDPWATHIGLGYAVRGGELRLIEAYSRKYVSWSPDPPSIAVSSSTVTLNGQIDDSMILRGVWVHWEPTPKPLSVRDADAIHTYVLPDRVRIIRSDAAESSGAFRLSVPLDMGPGLYTVVTHVSPRGGSKEIEGSSFSIMAVRPDTPAR